MPASKTYNLRASRVWHETIHDLGSLLERQTVPLDVRDKDGAYSDTAVVRAALATTTRALRDGARFRRSAIDLFRERFRDHVDATTSIINFYLPSQQRAESEWIAEYVEEHDLTTKLLGSLGSKRDRHKMTILVALYVALCFAIDFLTRIEKETTSA